MAIPLWLQHAIDTFGYLAIFVAVALETMGIPFPGETTLLTGAIYAGSTAQTNQLNIAGVIVAAALGAIVGDNVGYSIGYYGGRPLVLRILRLVHLPPQSLTYSERFFARHGDKTVLFGRFFSVLRVLSALLAGVSHMSRRTFFFWNATGGILWAVYYGILGYVLGRNLSLLDRVLKVMGIGGVVAIVLAGIAILVLLRRGHLLERLLGEEPAPDISSVPRGGERDIPAPTPASAPAPQGDEPDAEPEAREH